MTQCRGSSEKLVSDVNTGIDSTDLRVYRGRKQDSSNGKPGVFLLGLKLLDDGDRRYSKKMFL